MQTEVSSIDGILGRRSIRVFKDQEVADTTIECLLKAAMAAPSAVAKDPWRFVIVRKKETRHALAEALPNGKMLEHAPLCITVCGDLDHTHDKQLSYLIQDSSAAIQNILLAAHFLGLGACWLGVHPREERIHSLRSILSIPEAILPLSCIAVGHPAEKKESRTRFNTAYIHYDQW